MVMTLLLRSFPNQKIIFNGPYQAIRCGSKPKDPHFDTFIFDKKNGYLHYYDIYKDKFMPMSRRFENQIYSNSMGEFSSRLEVNKLLGKKLVITYITYNNEKERKQSIISKTIFLRWLFMYTDFQNSEEKTSWSIDSCRWINPIEVNTIN
tara:strand:+ start:486 stop:935 length:450 start_codon:yes stop_codon:yes gene_type:complete